MPNGDKIVQLPSGERVQFPGTMPDSAINVEITKYLGGNQAPPPAEPNRGFFGTVGDKLKSALQSIVTDPTGGRPLSNPKAWLDLSATTPPMIKQATRPLPKDLPTDVLGGGQGATGAGPIGRGIYRAATTLSPLVPFLDPEAMERKSAKGDVGGVAAEAVVPATAALAPAGMEAIKKGGIGAMREVMGEGPSTARTLADQHAHAIATRQRLTDLAGAVHSDAQNAMSQVLARVDDANPGGVFKKADIQGKVKTAVGDLVQVPEKLPPSLNKILKTEEVAPPTVGGRTLDLKNPGDLAAYQRMKASGAFTPDEIKRIEGGGDTLTAEQLKQMRSDVGAELARYGDKGVVGAALKKSYGILSSELRGAAAGVGAETDWLRANNKYSQYARDFTRKGPLRLALNNQTAAGIMEPLTGTSRQIVMDTLQKYKDAGFNVDTDWLEGQMRQYTMGKKTLGLSKPTKMDLLMAGFSPKALAIRQLGPRIFRNPKVLSRFSGAEDVPMPTREVYPSKAAAMKAKKP